MNHTFQESQASRPARTHSCRKIRKETPVWSPTEQTDWAAHVVKKRAGGVSTKNTLSSAQKALFADTIFAFRTHVVTNEEPTPDEFVLVADDDTSAGIQDLGATHPTDIETDFVVVDYE